MAAQALRQAKTLAELLGFSAAPVRACPTLDGYEGPAVWLDPDGAVADRNLEASQILDPLGGLDSGIAALAGRVRTDRVPQMAQISLPADLNGGARALDVTAIPHEGGVLVLARDASAGMRNVQMLKASRTMFREIALCAGGFAFETSAKGLFTWVGQGAPLGHRQEDLIGRPAKELLAGTCDLDPFSTRDELSSALIWLNSAGRGPRAMRMSVRPVFDRAGQWGGVRGHAHDVTEELRALRRDRVAAAIVEAGLEQPNPHDAQSAVASAVADACGVEAAWIINKGGQVPCAGSGAAPACEMTREIAARVMSENAEAPILFSAGAWSGLAIALRSRRAAVGALVIARPTAEGLVDHEAAGLLREIAPMVALVTVQTQSAVRAETVARRDPLTQLLTKAAFLDDVRRAQGTASVQAQTPLLLVIACAQFKAIADGLGAAACDELLLEISRMLKDVAGADGLVSRLGPCEFAIWISHAATDIEDRVTGQISHGFRNASRRMSMALSVSPDVAALRPDAGETLDAMLARAGQTLAATRKGPRGRTVMQKC
jgi:diguanylate cyclase (GGDEF)-like protein